MTKRTCIFVLGMHRSGTSAVTGLLQIMGIELGNDLMQPWPDNEKGFFENNKIWKYNQNLLENFHSSWDDPFLTEKWYDQHDLDDFRQPIKELLDNQFGSANLFAIKDPRLCILFPLWKEILDGLGIESTCILPVRHPLEVAKSLQNRNNFSLEKGSLLWLNHVLSAEKLSRGYSRIYINFDDLFSFPEDVLGSVQKKLNFNFPKTLEESKGQIHSFLDKNLKHHTGWIFGRSRVDAILAELYNLFRQASPNKSEDSHWQHSVDRINIEYQELYQCFMIKDLSELVACPGKLGKREEKILELEEILSQLRNENEDLQNEKSLLTKNKSSLQQEIEAMRNTKAWKLAEVLRKTFSGNKG